LPLDRPGKLKSPLLSAVVVALAAPVRVTVTPVPFAAGLLLPDMLRPEVFKAVKSMPVTLVVPKTVLWLEGVKLKPVLLGLSV